MATSTRVLRVIAEIEVARYGEARNHYAHARRQRRHVVVHAITALKSAPCRRPVRCQPDITRADTRDAIFFFCMPFISATAERATSALF